MKKKKKKQIWITAIVLISLSILIMGAISKQGTSQRTEINLSDIPKYAERGPYTVGIQEDVIQGSTTLEITVWYPASSLGTPDQDYTYAYEVKLGKPLGSVPIASFTGDTIEDATFDLVDTPYPLVILSPGFSIGSTAYSWLAEHLASYGFVVISPDHNENLDPENQLWRSAITRPNDILKVFAYVDQETKPGGTYAGLIASQTAAVVGHSYGGYTSLAAAGAQFNTDSFQSLCEDTIDNDEPGAWLCEMLLPKIEEMANLADIKSVPDGLWPAQADPRVDAIIPMAGDAFFFGEAGLSQISVPVLAIGGTADEDSPYLWGTHPSYQHASSSRKAELALVDAEHMISTGPCETIPWYLKFFSGEFCADTSWDRIYAQLLTKHFSIAFLLAELKGDSKALIYLAPGKAAFEGVRYESTGY